MLRVVEVPQHAPHALARHWVSVVRNTPLASPEEEVVLLLLVPEVLLLPRPRVHDLAQARQLLLVAKQES